MKLVALLLSGVASFALADVGLKSGGTYVGPVRDLNCVADAGISCARVSSAVRADISVVPASTTQGGIVTKDPQSFAGDKTFSGFVRLIGVPQGSLTACDSAHKGMLQGDTTTNSLVWCDGTKNIEYTGGGGSEQSLATLYVNGIVAIATLGSFSVENPSAAAATITRIEGSALAGTTSDGGTVDVRFTDGANVCDCLIPCATSGGFWACSGNCTYVDNTAAVTASGFADTCTTDPVIVGNLNVKGFLQ